MSEGAFTTWYKTVKMTVKSYIYYGFQKAGVVSGFLEDLLSLVCFHTKFNIRRHSITSASHLLSASFLMQDWGSVVTTMTRLQSVQLRNHSLLLAWERDFYPPQCPDRLWTPPILLFIGYQWMFLG